MAMSRPFAFVLGFAACAALGPFISSLDAQMPVRPLAPSQSRSYLDGSVWVLEFGRLKEGASDRYLEELATSWRALLEQARGEGVVLSYKVLQSAASTPRDWDLLTMIEVRNMAALDGINLRLGEISGGRVLPQDVTDLRDVVSTRIAREILLRPPR